MNMRQILNRLEREEVNGKNAPDMREVLRNERFGLLSALASPQDKAAIGRRMTEAVRVARMWGVDI